MKVVHINMSRKAGGASIAASRHSEAMCRAGIDSSMLTLEDLTGGTACTGLSALSDSCAPVSGWILIPWLRRPMRSICIG